MSAKSKMEKSQAFVPNAIVGNSPIFSPLNSILIRKSAIRENQRKKA
jgi:hypothetical protein